MPSKKERSEGVVLGFRKSEGQGHFLDPRPLSPGGAWGQSPCAPPHGAARLRDRGRTEAGQRLAVEPRHSHYCLLSFQGKGLAGASGLVKPEGGSLRSRAAGETPHPTRPRLRRPVLPRVYARFQVPEDAHRTVPHGAHRTVPAPRDHARR